MTDRYKRFVPHEDNVNEIISADHVNELQNQVEGNQREGFRQDDVDFLDRGLFVLNNHPVINSLYADIIEDTSKLDMISSPGLEFSKDESGIVFDESGAVSATLLSKSYLNPSNTNIRQVIFMASYLTPGASRMNFELSNNGIDFYPVTPGESEVFEFPTTGSKLQMRATFIRNVDEESPLLKGFHILFRDPRYTVTLLEDPVDGGAMEGMSHKDLSDVGEDDHHAKMHSHDGTDGSGLISHMSLTNVGEDDHHKKNHKHGEDGIDLVDLGTDVTGSLGMEHLSHTLWTGKEGDLTLIRNPLAEDKLVQITSPEDETYLFYDWANGGRLQKTISVIGDVAVEENLTYGPYVNGAGVTEEVMVGTVKYVKDATDADVLGYIATVMAPAPV